MRRRPTADVSQVLIDGPWRHRMVAANGARFHVVEAGAGPMVLLLHGFAQFWWAWRNQIEPLAAAGYRVVAMDLRGYGASDKPPRGYDAATLTADVAGVVRALGENQAVIVGQDWGAWIAWAMPIMRARQTAAIAAVSMPHPLALYREIATGRSVRTTATLAAYQVPWIPQRRLAKDGSVAQLITGWWGDGSPDPTAIDTYTAAVRLPSVAATSLNGFRWAGRGITRRDARRFRERMSAPIDVPVLVVHGMRDTWIRPGAQAVSHRYVSGPYRARIVSGSGHLVPEEAPEAFNQLLLEWLSTQNLSSSVTDAASGPDRLSS